MPGMGRAVPSAVNSPSTAITAEVLEEPGSPAPKRAACRALMRERGAPVTDAALKCAFNDSKSFARAFRKLMGMTTSAWLRAQAVR